MPIVERALALRRARLSLHLDVRPVRRSPSDELGDRARCPCRRCPRWADREREHLDHADRDPRFQHRFQKRPQQNPVPPGAPKSTLKDQIQSSDRGVTRQHHVPRPSPSNPNDRTPLPACRQEWRSRRYGATARGGLGKSLARWSTPRTVSSRVRRTNLLGGVRDAHLTGAQGARNAGVGSRRVAVRDLARP